MARTRQKFDPDQLLKRDLRQLHKSQDDALAEYEITAANVIRAGGHLQEAYDLLYESAMWDDWVKQCVPWSRRTISKLRRAFHFFGSRVEEFEEFPAAVMIEIIISQEDPVHAANYLLKKNNELEYPHRLSKELAAAMLKEAPPPKKRKTEKVPPRSHRSTGLS